MPDVSFRVANFLGLGEEFEKTSSGTSRTLIRLRLAGRTMEIRQDPSVVLGSRRDFAGMFVPTTTIAVKAVALRHHGVVQRIIEDVCWLLSLASMSRVVPFQLDSPPGKMVRGWSVVGSVGGSWTLIEIRNGTLVRKFLEQTLPLLRKLRNKRRIIACIDGLLSAELGHMPLELRMVAVYITLEMLKDTWARGKGIPYRKGYFWRTSLKGKQEHYPFEDLLRDMCAEVRMRPSLRRLVQYRNALIHSGGLRLANRTKNHAYDASQRLAREYILRRLRYRGPFFVFGALKVKTLR